jgi:hypothetical protein
MNAVGRWLRSFGAFWWDFVVGDDWRIAAAVIVGLGVTAVLAHDDVTAWWVLPVTVTLILGLSLAAAVRRRD